MIHHITFADGTARDDLVLQSGERLVPLVLCLAARKCMQRRGLLAG